MLPARDAFEFDYFGSDIVYGRGAVQRLGDYLGQRGLEDALVVCGSHVGANEDLMERLEAGLSGRLAGVFDGTTPDKTAAEAYDGIAAMREVEADVLVGVGGGSSLDIARQMSVFAADGRPLSEFVSAAKEGRSLSANPTEPLIPVVVVPTTFAGADVSSGGSIEVLTADESPTGQPMTSSGSVWPIGMFYDPELFETTPPGAIAGSAMNGFDKAIETVYAADGTPITDATCVRGLRLLKETFPELPGDAETMDRAVVGIILAQFRRTISIVHAFGHGFARRYPVQQGRVHAVVVPHVLRYVFDEVDGQRHVLADGLGVDTAGRSEEEVATAVVDEVVAVRDGFDLPTRLRELDPVDRDDFRSIAEFILADPAMNQAPVGLDARVEDVEQVLHDAW